MITLRHSHQFHLNEHLWTIVREPSRTRGCTTVGRAATCVQQCENCRKKASLFRSQSRLPLFGIFPWNHLRIVNALVGNKCPSTSSVTSFYRRRFHLCMFFFNVTTHCLALRTSPSFTFHTNSESSEHIVSRALASQRRTLTICGILFDAAHFKSCSLHGRSKQWIRQVQLPLLLPRAQLREQQRCFSCAWERWARWPEMCPCVSSFLRRAHAEELCKNV